MAIEQRLHFAITEPDQPPPFYQVFDILYEILQPDSSDIEDAVQRITQLLPKGRPYSNEVDTFLTTCYNVAEQIPYSHPSLIKLVTIIELCLMSSHFDGEERKLGHIDRCQKVAETLREWWDSTHPFGDDDETPEKYVSFHTFAARLLEKGLVRGQAMPIWSIQRAIRAIEKCKNERANPYVKVASQWLLIRGDAVYENRGQEKLEESEWDRWHERLRAVASGDANTEAFGYDQEAVELAGKAVAAMKTIEAAHRQSSSEEKADAGKDETSSQQEKTIVEGQKTEKQEASVKEQKTSGAGPEKTDAQDKHAFEKKIDNEREGADKATPGNEQGSNDEEKDVRDKQNAEDEDADDKEKTVDKKEASDDKKEKSGEEAKDDA